MKHWDTLKSDTKRRQEKEIGLISFYGKQVNNIKLNVKPYAQKLGIPVKLNTVDKFQGMERNIIIVSTVRSDRALKANGTIRKMEIQDLLNLQNVSMLHFHVQEDYLL